ncbi:MAG: hypothetical protein JWO31_2771 [Phycisphaerales bacterium]|nr:hypothetical protein [Phycisphaerales bacterium]
MTQVASNTGQPFSPDPYVGSTPRAGLGRPAESSPPTRPAVNVGTTERQLSMAGGAALALIGLRMRSLTGLVAFGAGASLIARGYTGHCGVYKALGKSTAVPAEPNAYHKSGIHVSVAYTIAKPRAELFAFWRNFANLPKFMDHVQSVRVTDDKRSHWVVKAPAGRTVEWDAEIINEVPDELIAWRSLGGADVDNAGSVRFVDAPGDRGTEVRVVLDYIPPAGRLGKYVAMLFGEAPEIQIKEDLRRFKRLMETGYPPITDGQPHGQR